MLDVFAFLVEVGNPQPNAAPILGELRQDLDCLLAGGVIVPDVKFQCHAPVIVCAQNVAGRQGGDQRKNWNPTGSSKPLKHRTLRRW